MPAGAAGAGRPISLCPTLLNGGQSPPAGRPPPCPTIVISHLNDAICLHIVFTSPSCSTLLAAWPLAGGRHCLSRPSLRCRVALVHCSTCLCPNHCCFDHPPCSSHFLFPYHTYIPPGLSEWPRWVFSVTASGDPVSRGVANRRPAPSIISYLPLQLPTGHSLATGAK